MPHLCEVHETGRLRFRSVNCDALEGRKLCSASPARAVSPARTALTALTGVLARPSAIKRDTAAEANSGPSLCLASIQKSFLGHGSLFGHVATDS